MPSVRTYKLTQCLESLDKACRNNSYEVLLASPFSPPRDYPNVRHVKTHMCPTSACQAAAEEATGRLICIFTDDSLFFEGRVDDTIAHYDLIGGPNIINMRYTEGPGYSGRPMEEGYWMFHHHDATRSLPGIPHHYALCCSPLMARKDYVELGGLDCSYEFMNFALHDFICRAQACGFIIHPSASEVFNCDHMPGRTGDHYAVHDSHESDLAIFRAKYSQADALTRLPLRIPFDNWKDHAHPWHRRFPAGYLPDTYEEMMSLKVE